MSRGHGLLTPELRATIIAVLANRLHRCNPDDQTPAFVDDTPDVTQALRHRKPNDTMTVCWSVKRVGLRELGQGCR